VWVAGVFWGAGVQANVDKAVKFATEAFRNASPEIERIGNKIRISNTTVNLAGHSRGSITCYKIAHALRKFPGIKINIFAIDPVPGNNGRINKTPVGDYMSARDRVLHRRTTDRIPAPRTCRRERGRLALLESPLEARIDPHAG
jgi:hypothetical protein